MQFEVIQGQRFQYKLFLLESLTLNDFELHSDCRNAVFLWWLS